MEILLEIKKPYVISDSYLKTPHAVSIDRESGIIEALTKQKDKYDTYQFLTNTPGETELRKIAFQKGSAAAEVKKKKIIFCDNGLFEGGLAAGLEVIKEKNSLTLCYNDRMAAGLLKSLYLSGCDVPGDYGIIGFDDDNFTGYTHKSISTITQSTDELADKTFKLLDKQIKGGKAEKMAPVATRFIARETTK